MAAALRAGECTAVEVAQDLLLRLDSLEPLIGAVAATDPARTIAEAEAADKRLCAGEARAFEGVPFTVKEWIDVAGWPVSGTILAGPGDPDRRPAVDASAVARLRAAGGVVLAITRAWAGNVVYGPTRNPHDPTRAPGGSSSGAAALVAAGASPVALGSDSGGSIRLPAAWCGVPGLRPTFGRVPLTGHFPRCGSLEDGRTVIGPLANTVDDLAAVLALIAGPDGLDAGVPPVPLRDPAEVDLSALRVGLAGAGPAAIAVDALVAAGASVVAEPILDVREEALHITRRYWARSELTGQENLRLLWDWDRFRRRMLVATAAIDILITPASDEPAPPWRESTATDYLWMLPWSLTGAPAVVVPVGLRDGLPMAAQLVARPWQDHVALAAARCVEAFAGPIPRAEPDASPYGRGGPDACPVGARRAPPRRRRRVSPSVERAARQRPIPARRPRPEQQSGTPPT